jgi:L-alanine-DL-glutamate epimerase-like enolase superfamily enzyme
VGHREVARIIDDRYRPLLIGEDPFARPDIARKLSSDPTTVLSWGHKGAECYALSGIDIALWDIAGKVAQLPVYALLGGKFRESAEVYASSMRRDMTPAEEAERAVSFQEQGYRAYKIHSATPWMYDVGFDQTIDTVREMRAAVGDSFDILVDTNNSYYPHTAISIARRLEEYRTWHFEEPLAAHDYSGYAKLAAAVDIPIAVGEQEYSRWQFRDLILQGEVDILQPDVIKCGGITEFRKIAALAQTFNKPITVHNTQPTVGTLAHLHLWVSTHNCVYPQEYNIEPHPLRDEWPIWQEPVLVQDGRMYPPDRPGLGIDLDENVVSRISTTAIPSTPREKRIPHWGIHRQSTIDCSCAFAGSYDHHSPSDTTNSTISVARQIHRAPSALAPLAAELRVP